MTVESLRRIADGRADSEEIARTLAEEYAAALSMDAMTENDSMWARILAISALSGRLKHQLDAEKRTNP